ncbi:MAG: hypothetical protein U0521_21320 [Anaerolineae bacterium]
MAAAAVGLANVKRLLLRYTLSPHSCCCSPSTDRGGRSGLSARRRSRDGAVLRWHLTADDSVIVAWSYADWLRSRLLLGSAGGAGAWITLPEGADLDAVLLLPTSGDVALNVWYTQRADYRGMMGCLLGGGMTDDPQSYTTYGMTTLVYRRPSLKIPALVPSRLYLRRRHAKLAARAPTRSGGLKRPAPTAPSACRYRSRCYGDTDADLKARLIVQNDLAGEVASADAIFATASQRTSAALALAIR